jgi:hypothetical protein
VGVQDRRAAARRFTFTERGEYFFNDTFDPRPTGKIEVY